ncbi:MAG: hypothetical protein KDJ29_13865, partial [Hyphomicrobiales bacterium]|nr:hypothetical protein [Hyphomicrobiales bacterium]
MSNGLRSATTPFAQALNAVRSSTIRSCFLGSCLAALVIGAAPAAAATKAEVRGKAFVTLHCSKCHAIGL